jgi:hypothetical protein
MNFYRTFYGQYPTGDEIENIQKRVEEALGNFIQDYTQDNGVASVNTRPAEDSPASMDVIIPEGVAYSKVTVQADAGANNVDTILRMAWSGAQTIDCSQDYLSVSTIPSAGNKRYISCFVKFVRAESDPKLDLDGNTIYYKQFEDCEFEVHAGTESAGTPARVTSPGDEYCLLFEVLLDETVTQIDEPSDWLSPGDNEIDITQVNYLATDEIQEARDGYLKLKDKLDTLAGTFLQLDDAPSSFTGEVGKVPAVNSGENALEFVSIIEYYDYVIQTQEDFEELFGSSWGDTGATFWDAGLSAMVIPEGTTILLKPITGNLGSSWTAGYGDDGTNTFNGEAAYILRNKVYLSDNVVIHGLNQDTCIIIKNDGDNTNEDDIKFYSTYKAQTAVGGVSTNDFTVTDSSGFVVGDFIHHSQDNEFYQITSIPDGTSIIVDRDISGSGSENLSSMVCGVKMQGWAFDGRGGVNGLGGSIDGTDKSGGAFNVLYLGNSILNLKIINHKITYSSSGGFGGAIYGGDVLNPSTSYNIEAINIVDCMVVSGIATEGGGGVSGVVNSKLIIKRCSSGNNGGGVIYCDYCKIEVYDCITTNDGGGVANCNYSDVYASKCKSSVNNGGGVSTCDYCKIIVFECTATGPGGLGGGAYSCDYSEITAFDCNASVQGGGAYGCDYSKIIAFDCTSSNGDIAHSCDNCESIWGDSGTIVSCTTGGVGLGMADKLSVADIDDTPADDADVPVSSQHLYRLTNSRCSVYLSGNQNIDTGTNTLVTFDSVVTNSDPLSLWNTTGNYFTPDYDGWYAVTGQVTIDDLNDGDSAQISIFLGVVEKKINISRQSANGVFTCVSIYALLYITTSDQLKFYAKHDEGTTQVISAQENLTSASIHAISLD